MALPLAGLRVLDLSNVLAGQFCGYQLGLLGAEVIKIEVPGNGDLARRLGADCARRRQEEERGEPQRAERHVACHG